MIRNLAALTGLVSISIGAFLVDAAAGFIAVGAGCMWVAWSQS